MIPLNEKEGEALLWGLSIIGDLPERDIEGPQDPLGVLLNEGFSRHDLAERCKALENFAYGNCIVAPLAEIDRSILRACVENTTWLKAYAQYLPELLDVAKAALRTFARKLDQLGVEVNHIPNC
jgi:hypothetical protein